MKIWLHSLHKNNLTVFTRFYVRLAFFFFLLSLVVVLCKLLVCPGTGQTECCHGEHTVKPVSSVCTATVSDTIPSSSWSGQANTDQDCHHNHQVLTVSQDGLCVSLLLSWEQTLVSVLRRMKVAMCAIRGGMVNSCYRLHSHSFEV